MNKLPQRFLEPIYWWLWEAPKRIYVIVRRLLILSNHKLSFTLNIRLLFVPFFGDYTLIGRIIGFIFRIFWLFGGLIILLLLTLFLFLAPVLWYFIPLLLAYYLGWFYLPLFFLLLYVIRLWSQSDVPLHKVSSSRSEKYLSTVRPSSYKLIRSIKSNQALTPLVSDESIAHLLKKLELNPSEFLEKTNIATDFDTWKLLKSSYELALKQKTRYVEKEHLFYALLNLEPDLTTLLMSFGLTISDVEETIDWIVSERERLSRVLFWQEDYHLDKLGGFGRGLTGRVTPALDSVSTDFTQMAKKGLIRGIIAHQEEIKEIADLLASDSKANVLIIGQPGSGKTSVVMGIAKAIVEGTEYEQIQNKRIVSVETGSLVSGAKTPGEIAKKLNDIMKEVKGSGDIILFFDEIHTLASSIAGEDTEVSSIYSILEPHLSSGEFQIIGATNRNTYRKYIEPNGAFARLFNMIDIEPSSPEETEEILKHLTHDIEWRKGILVTLPAIKKLIRYSDKLMFDRVFPDKAVDILNRCVNISSKEEGVTSEKVAAVISQMTHVPVSTLTEEESQKVLSIGQKMQERVIGQDQAVNQIANALKRSSAGIRDENKPIASFLFVGSTGVGKTETAKTLSREFFGAEGKMIRLDMSEYQQSDSVDKLIGTSGGTKPGILTEAIRSHPFSVVLLDEIEKADSNVLLTFLQVLDDGRLTDSSGITVSFANTIIIATSNVGTREIQLVASREGSFNEMEEAALNRVREHFVPEFLNRFSGIIVFNPLSREDVKKIALILLGRVEEMAKEKNITVNFTDDLLEGLVREGFSPEWGARPLARVIEDKVETYIAEKLLSGEYKPGDTVTLDSSVF